MKLLIVLPTSGPGGHNVQYGLAIARAGRSNGWLIDLATPLSHLDHPAGREIAAVIESVGGKIVDIPDFTPHPRGKADYIEGQLRRWNLIREAGYTARKLRRHDLAYVDGCDGWYIPCTALGLPISGVPAVSVMLRTRYHHASLGYGASYPVRNAYLQRFFIERFLRLALLAAVVTPDKPWADFCSNAQSDVRRKVHYVPDMGKSVARIPRDEAKRRLGIGFDKRIVLCLGTPGERKGVDALLAAASASECPRSMGVLLMGIHDGGVAALPGANFAKQLVEEGRLWLRSGAYTEEELGWALSATDVVWVGYRGHPYSSGILWEAAQAGIPLLGCNSGLIAWEIRSRDIGETVQIDDPSQVISALKRLMDDPDRRATCSQNGFRAGAEHTPERFGGAVAQAMENLWSGGNR